LMRVSWLIRSTPAEEDRVYGSDEVFSLAFKYTADSFFAGPSSHDDPLKNYPKIGIDELTVCVVCVCALLSHLASCRD
jgi:hypothetical protein